MEPTIFTRIIKGEIPCHKVYEDDYSFAFMDIHPIQPGQVLVISKRQVENFHELEGEEYDELWRAVHKVAKRLKQHFTDKDKIGIQVEGLDVPHVHVKVFPFSTSSEFRSVPNPNAEPDDKELARLASQLAF
jgi:histidine triad (HIT) family protein